MLSTTRTKLSKKVAIVTGSSSGIGQGFAVELAKIGYAVTIHGRDTERLQKTREMCLEAGCSKDEVLIVEGDLLEEQVLKNIAENTYSRFGRIDVLINNAAFAPTKDECLADVDATSFDMSFKVNVRAPVLLSRHVVPALKETKGCIVFISSVAVTANVYLMYSGMKAAIEHAMATTALELASVGVRVNCLRAGAMFTPIWDKLISTPAQKELVNTILSKCIHPVGRQMSQVDINNALKFLLSEDSSFITGLIFSVSGGGHLPFERNAEEYKKRLYQLHESERTTFN